MINMTKIDKIIKEDLPQHYLNEALNQCLERAKIKINEEYLLGEALEYDYYKLLEAFESHLKMIEKLNKGD
jgi:hypothetical protein